MMGLFRLFTPRSGRDASKGDDLAVSGWRLA